jgi:hypothetical protein
MTVRSTNRDQQLTYVMRWLLAGVFILGILTITVYNETATLKRLTARQDKAVAELKLQNAELKNSFYAVLDTRTLVTAAERLGFVRDNTPSYLTFRSDGTVTQDTSSVSLKP